MSSYKEAFSKLNEWRRLNVVLKLTMLTGEEKPQTLFVQISALDEDSLQVGFTERGKRYPKVLLLSDASFDVGQRVLEVKRSATDILMFASP